jgi:hypothetical protein
MLQVSIIQIIPWCESGINLGFKLLIETIQVCATLLGHGLAKWFSVHC